MASHHASLCRRTLEEIRQKRAAERLTKASSGPDLTKPPNPDDGGIKKSESGNRLSELRPFDSCVSSSLSCLSHLHLHLPWQLILTGYGQLNLEESPSWGSRNVDVSRN